MEKMAVRYFRLFIGLFFCAIGIVITINANLGYSPWDVLHQGIGNILNTTIGTANIIVGVLIVSIEIIMGQRPGIGTFLNMSLIGVFMNIIMNNDLINFYIFWNDNIRHRIISIHRVRIWSRT